MRDRWDIFKDEPIASASELCYCLRRICNTNEEKQAELLEILEDGEYFYYTDANKLDMVWYGSGTARSTPDTRS